MAHASGRVNTVVLVNSMGQWVLFIAGTQALTSKEFSCDWFSAVVAAGAVVPGLWACISLNKTRQLRIELGTHETSELTDKLESQTSENQLDKHTIA